MKYLPELSVDIRPENCFQGRVMKFSVTVTDGRNPPLNHVQYCDYDIFRSAFDHMMELAIQHIQNHYAKHGDV